VGYRLSVNGSANEPGFFVDDTDDGTVSRNFSKPLRDLSSNDTITVEVSRKDGSGTDIEGWSDFHHTFLSGRKFG
jgi:hypothetical protein